MVRPFKKRFISFFSEVKYYKPQGIPLSELEEVRLTPEEIEALRLKNLLGFEQIDCAKKMLISQSTFQRTLSSAYKKISDALVNGKAIRIK